MTPSNLAPLACLLAALFFSSAAGVALADETSGEVETLLDKGTLVELIEKADVLLRSLDNAISKTEERTLLGGSKTVDRVKLKKLKEQRERIVTMKNTLSQELDDVIAQTE